MWPARIVEGEPARELGEPMVVGLVEPCVGPFVEQGSDKSLSFAVGLGSIGSGGLVAGAQRGDGLAKNRGEGIGHGPVRQDSFDPNALLRIERPRFEQKAGGRDASLIGKDTDEGQPTGVVDRHMEILIALRGATTHDSLPATESVSAVQRNSTQLLDVQVNQLAWP